MYTLKIVKLALGAPLTLQRGGLIIRYAWLYLAWYWATFGSKKIDPASRVGLGTEKNQPRLCLCDTSKIDLWGLFYPLERWAQHSSAPQCWVQSWVVFEAKLVWQGHQVGSISVKNCIKEKLNWFLHPFGAPKMGRGVALMVQIVPLSTKDFQQGKFRFM